VGGGHGDGGLRGDESAVFEEQLSGCLDEGGIGVGGQRTQAAIAQLWRDGRDKTFWSDLPY
jgi:hypothetical protein